jgi:hypothetical protein
MPDPAGPTVEGVVAGRETGETLACPVARLRVLIGGFVVGGVEIGDNCLRVASILRERRPRLRAPNESLLLGVP